MPNSRIAVRTFSGVLTVLAASVVSGQNYPNRPIHIFTSEAGGGSDFPARLVALGIAGPLGQPVIIENRPSGVIPTEIVANAPPDGYTLTVAGSSLWITPLLQKTTYDPVRNFSPITLLTSTPQLLVVHPSVPVKSVKELIALAKTRPGELNYGSLPIGSTGHLATELFKALAGVSIVRIPYKGTASAINDLIGGQVQLMFSNAAPAMPQVKSGRLRALAVTTAEPSALFPGLPTVAVSLPGYQAATKTSLFAPAKTPVTIINVLNQEVVKVLNSPEAKEKFFSAGSEVVGNSPEEFAAFIKSDMARMGKVIKDAGIRGE